MYKDECTQCFASWNDREGINVCLTCFNGGCRDHAAIHHQRSGHSLSVRIFRFKKPLPADQPEPQITKVAIGVEGGAKLDSEDQYDYRYEAECWECERLLDPTESATISEVRKKNKPEEAKV